MCDMRPRSPLFQSLSVDDPTMIGRSQLGDIAFIIVNPSKQCIERRTEIETAAAPVADFVDPQGFLVQLFGINRVDEAEALHGGCAQAFSHWYRTIPSPWLNAMSF